ncbi:SDR family oxidoreductase [Paracoccus sp. CPCC 101403]|uniref:SDR family oxidoreductase n=2 Tax=Paracoccus broussonetiae TaxID=3075834 RepID=A0ABU3EG98_9RHOB|nr:SDR family oxidoreductase [Paracoccus sp. CPCC 101403]MDT1063209.1 SDR family oxidoreductase [Paracoccus sp. CPCC 101403]
MSWLELQDKTVVITGAGGGIGRALCQAFAAQGARVVALDRDAAALGTLTEELGQSAVALACDLSKGDEIEAAAARVDELGGADVLINNAGILRPGPLDSIAEADWSAMLRINLTGYLLTSQAFGRAMLARGAGAIVHVSSIAGSQPQPASGAYSASKSAILMLSRQMAQEWGPRGVRSNCVSPGLVRTPLSEAFYADPETKARREEMVPLRRIAAPEDMAEVALFLASPRASYVTGQEIVVDGGLSQSLMGLVPRPGYS